ncbi:MAG: hypothetical protein HYV66_02560 [Candidatus Sungbacteria bacterium]|uniref:LTD domain-containing protein n=1 Tax=Candidatus Sungiibacteriota bacterium TaxID=2750080 RepID=A0A931YDS1_9BACT|nr:hypothetical protein [Candidatus Sungbacteria bacterium]
MVIFVLVGVLVIGAGGSVKAGKVGDIVKRSKLKSSVFISPSRQREVQMVRNSVFFSPLETAVVGGPEHNGFIQNTKVEFTLDGWQIVPFEKVRRFDVWLIGYDGGWKETGSKVVYNLPAGRKTYTLLARAKNSAGEFDNTAAVRTFMVNVSEHFGKIKIAGVVRQGSAAKPYYEKLTLRNQNSDLGINVSGWTIRAERSRFSFAIPAATRVYNPREFSANDPIVLTRNASVDVYVGKKSPLGVNFQENSCDGYLAGSFEGYDSLSASGRCVLPDSSSYNHFSIACRTFVRGISGCSTPRLTAFQFGGEPACRDFIVRNYNYQSCVERAKNRADFYQAKWKVYLGRAEEIFDDLNDKIYLYDNTGLLVDAYSY